MLSAHTWKDSSVPKARDVFMEENQRQQQGGLCVPGGGDDEGVDLKKLFVQPLRTGKDRLQVMLQLMVMKELRKVKGDEETSLEDAAPGAQAFRRLFQKQQGVFRTPDHLVGEYGKETMQNLRVEPGKPWQW